MKSSRLESFLSLFHSMRAPPKEGSETRFDIIPDSFQLPNFSSVIGMIGLMGSPPLETAPSAIPTESSPTELLPPVPGSSELLPSNANFTRALLKSILTSIDSKDPFVANAWLETLLDVIDLLPKEVVRDEILSLTIRKGQSLDITSRLASCKLIGKISTKFEPYVLKTEVVGIVQSLCQDVCGEVRGSMCVQLAMVAKGVGLDTTKSVLLPELVDLCSDEEIGVRLAGINTVVQLLPLLNQETRMNVLVPLVKKICERALRGEDATLPVTAHLLGRICHGLHDDLSEDLKLWFINFYCSISKLGLPDAKKPESPMPDLVSEARNLERESECRQQCAYNLPGMMVFAGGAFAYKKHLHEALSSFVTDPSLPVRITIALAFHQVCTLIGSEVGLVRDAFLQLMRSDNMDILCAIVPNVSHILAAFHHHRVITQTSGQTEVIELIGALKQGEAAISISSNWRVHSEALRQVAALALCLSPDVLFAEVVPLMVVRMHTVRPIPCRQSASRTLLVYLRHMKSSEHKNFICNTLVTEFCESRSCHKRMLFLTTCRFSFDLLPKNVIKSHFFKPLLSLHMDKVPNIRLKLVTMLPAIKSILVLPDDKHKLLELESTVGSLLKKESDKDVTAAISSAINQLDEIEISESERRSPEGAASEDSSLAEQELKINKTPVEEEKENVNNMYKHDKISNAKVALKNAPKPVLGLSARRSNVPGRIPSYVAAERRKSRTFAPEMPPDEKEVMRISALDPSADEFLVDAGIRIDDAAIQNHLAGSHGESLQRRSNSLYFSHPGTPSTSRPPPLYSPVPGRHNQPIQLQSRLRPPSTSKIPVKGKLSQDSDHLAKQKGLCPSEVITRTRAPSRASRPVSGIPSSANHAPIMSSRGKSLSHENLRSARLILPSSKSTTCSTESEMSRRITGKGCHKKQPSRGGPSSCNSSPGGSRCASPDEHRNQKVGSVSSSPGASRCSSPPRREEQRPLLRGGNRNQNGAPLQGENLKSRQAGTGSNSKGKVSRLPLPTSKK